jgi:hypothetical protein
VVDAAACSVYELRQYTLRPGSREEFVRLFERELLEPQEAAGMRVLGQFRDAERPDMFVWIRAFPDMEARRRSLTEFYGGPVWAAHREAANAMMLDSDDVLLLEPAESAGSLDAQAAARPSAGADALAAGELSVVITPVPPGGAERYLELHRTRVEPLVLEHGGRALPGLRSLHAPNTFPRLPVREGEHVAVTIAVFPDAFAAERLHADPGYRAAVADLGVVAAGAPQRLRLLPTPRCALR